MVKLQFKLSVRPSVGMYGIGYLLNSVLVVIRVSPKGYEITPARSFEAITVWGGVTFHAILTTLFWETTAATEKRIKKFSASFFENRIPTTRLTDWIEGEEIGASA